MRVSQCLALALALGHLQVSCGAIGAHHDLDHTDDHLDHEMTEEELKAHRDHHEKELHREHDEQHDELLKMGMQHTKGDSEMQLKMMKAMMGMKQPNKPVHHPDDHTYHKAVEKMKKDNRDLAEAHGDYSHLEEELGMGSMDAGTFGLKGEALANYTAAKQNLTEHHDKSYGHITKPFKKRQKERSEAEMAARRKEREDKEAAVKAEHEARMAEIRAQQQAAADQKSAEQKVRDDARAAEQAARSAEAAEKNRIWREEQAAASRAFQYKVVAGVVVFLVVLMGLFGYFMYILSDSYTAKQMKKRGYHALGQGIRVGNPND